ncbi:hypothetical protein ABEB36_006511 [Hypothenemus hampei]|uniref:protein-tyrosine-phosphatase n=1 Tax=Hypothenemus hampei TaxID=57062 RepID=A0ABD1EUP6_HYPHA
MKPECQEIERLIEIINSTLYFAVLKTTCPKRKLKSNDNYFYFSIDEELTYQNYYCDFGPLSLSCLFKYCIKLNKYLLYARGFKRIVHYTCAHPNKKTNAAYLIGAYCVIYLKMSPRDVYKLLQNVSQLKPFVDASQFVCTFTLKLIDCYNALAKAQTFNFVNLEDFNVSEYDLFNKLEYGNINWLLPRKFLAFIGPADNWTAHPPEFYIKYFLKNDVKTVIRLNNILYDACAFVQVGIQHYDLIFPDGSTPPKDILLKFLYITESAPAAIGVHCKAGLGRTGSLIAAYLIKHYRMTAREAIAWLRICRPGSVIGQQQIWLEKIQNWLWKIGSDYRLQHYGDIDKIPRHKYGIYSKLWSIERGKLIRETNKINQTSFGKWQMNNFMQTQNKRGINLNSEKLLKMNTKLIPGGSSSFKNISKLLTSVHGIQPSASISRNLKDCQMTSHIVSRSEKSIHCNLEVLPKKIVYKKPRKTVEKENNNQKQQIFSQGDKLNEIKLLRHQNGKNHLKKYLIKK